MKLQRTVIIAFCLFGLLAAGIVKPAYVQACSCAEPPPIDEQLKTKAAIFSGKVVSIVNPPKKKIMSSIDPVTVVFDVDKVWKGEIRESTSITTAMSGASCGYENFKLGHDFLVFAYESEGGQELSTGLCSGTKELSSASAELEALGSGDDPLPVGTGDSGGELTTLAAEHGAHSSSSQTQWLWVWLAAVALAAAALILFIHKWNRTP